ncbi:lactonase family protein [Paenibacillus sp. JX-17]|uniref:Lactonase family protein n=1 Tax=Paenibacillus lacisoli TaxID=3064525 RepID=A0ABT9CBW7_9BACL|nr:lactonase family protein [Paenibacillus sp. JX-17]MDO7906727.1 lactonase family protein [Paenibacillus sp. JX-17]
MVQQAKANETIFYAGTYASRSEQAIHVCVLNQENGEMRILSGIEGIERPSFIALNEEGTRLYAASETADGEVYVYRVDEKTGELHLLDRRATDGADTCYVSLSGDGQYVLASNYSGGNVNVFPAAGTSGLADMASQVKHEGSGIREDRQDAAHPHSVVSDRSGRYVFVCDLGLDQIVIYRLEEGGKLVTHRETNLPPGSGPRHLAFHPKGAFAYLVNELNNTVTVLSYNEQIGELTPLQHVSTLPEDQQHLENTAADIRITPCGRYLYASNRGHDSIVLYHIDPESGALTVQEWVETFGKTPRNFNILPGGYLLAANQDSDNIVSYAIHPDDGRLTRTGFVLEMNTPVCIEPMEKPKHKS